MSQQFNFQTIFKELKSYIERGYSVMPVRMGDEGDKKAKSPLFSFVKNPEKCKDLDYLFKIMNYCTVELGMALVTGELSNNLMCIDIDEKYRAGIGREYLTTIEAIYPDLYSKLRIETTLNHGIHIPFHTAEKTLRSESLASRLSTEKEKEENPKQKKYFFIETRGENATFIIPPTEGYSFIQDLPIPTLTASERDILINVAKSFHEVEEKIIRVKTSPKGMRNYSTNPWEDYNSSDHFISLLEEAGWEPLNSGNTKHQYFTRPGGKNDVHGSWVKDKNIFYVFTTSTEFEPDRGYQPSTVLSILKFNDDKKETFRWLIDNGYGEYNEEYENKIIERSIINRQPLPNNLSKKGKEKYEAKKDAFENKYPYGIFWEEIEERDELSHRINKELILRVAQQMNYYQLDGDLIYVDEHNKFIDRIFNPSVFFNDLKSYIKEDDELKLISILDKYESYIQKSGKFLITRLDEFPEEKILKDERFVCWKAFNNIILKITKDSIKEIEYSEIDKYVFKDQVIDFNFFRREDTDCLFTDFMNKALVNPERFKQNAGYYLHNYNHSKDAYFQVYTETVKNPKHGGGSGKDLMAMLLSLCTTSYTVPAETLKIDNTLLQGWSGQRLFIISDAPERFPFNKFKSLTTNAIEHKKLYKNVVIVKPSDLPKFLFTTNFSFNMTDGGVARRLIFQEFTDFFTRAKGVDTHYGDKQFPDDWSDEDWLGYYNFMMESIQVYLSDKKLRNSEMSESGWIKQFCINHGDPTYEFIIENINLFIQIGNVSKKKFENIYANFIAENGILPKYRKSSHGMNEALEEYCKHYNIEFKRSITAYIDGISCSCRSFVDIQKREQEYNDLPF